MKFKLDFKDLSELENLVESEELEFKLAQGQNGTGKLPEDFWRTYSAMANSRGGFVVLGVKEKKGRFSVEGIKNVEAVKKQLFDIASNQQKVSVNLLTSDDAEVHVIDDKNLIVVRIPVASRKQKPVFLNGKPIDESYIRHHEGDRHLSSEQVKRMLAEQVEDSRDDRILIGFTFSDINTESLKAYRNILGSAKPQHPWLDLDLPIFFEKIGGFRKDRQAGMEGITLAGLLMFGNWDAIQDACPYYFVDYRERENADSQSRWIDRICPDGTWSGNVFDFYRRTYRKLMAMFGLTVVELKRACFR